MIMIPMKKSGISFLFYTNDNTNSAKLPSKPKANEPPYQ